MTDFIRVRKLTAAQQAAGIRAMWPGFETSVRLGRLVARGRLRGSAITDEYDVRIEHHEREYPKIYVDRPALARRAAEPDRPIPHTYDADKAGRERPCVYVPATDWNSTMPIAKTIVPWLQSWLVDYEIWRATGVWSGGGRHASPKNEGAAP